MKYSNKLKCKRLVAMLLTAVMLAPSCLTIGEYAYASSGAGNTGGTLGSGGSLQSPGVAITVKGE